MYDFYLNYQTIYYEVTDTIINNKMHGLDVPDISLQKVTILLQENAIELGKFNVILQDKILSL